MVGCAAAAVTIGVLAFIAIDARTPRPIPASPPTAKATVAVAVPTFTMSGNFDVFVNPASTALADGASCQGSGASADIANGTAVSVFDGQGKLIAVGSLTNGTFARTPIGSACVFVLTVDGVPDGLTSYSVEVGQRGERPVSSVAAHGHVFLTDGS
jgi:hypothetical protein